MHVRPPLLDAQLGGFFWGPLEACKLLSFYVGLTMTDEALLGSLNSGCSMQYYHGGREGSVLMLYEVLVVYLNSVFD